MWIVLAKNANSILPSAVSHNVLLIKRACIARPKRLHGIGKAACEGINVRRRGRIVLQARNRRRIPQQLDLEGILRFPCAAVWEGCAWRKEEVWAGDV